MAKRVVLAYSGGLDTSVAVRWMIEEMNVEVIALAADVGQGGDWEAIKQRALAAGATEAIVLDLREEYANEFVAPALKANAKYEGKYPLISSLSRPIIVKYLVETARAHGADAVAHGCTGKGNDQVRFEVSTAALAPDLEVIAPVRGWGITREQSIELAEKWGIPITVTKSSPYSIDQNLWGRTIECGILEDPWEQPPEEVFELTTPTATGPTELVVAFEQGLPVALDGKRMPLTELIAEVDRTVGSYGWGRIDMIENRRVGIKSREVYECPGALALLMAHADLEDLTLERDLAHEKARLEPRYADARRVRRGEPEVRHRGCPPAVRASRTLHSRRPPQRGRPVRLFAGDLRGGRPFPASGRGGLRPAVGSRRLDLGGSPDQGQGPMMVTVKSA
jgi:argininosuccinate synthase